MLGKTSNKPARVAKKTAVKQVATKPKLLSGGNPQIAKGEGDAPVRAYIAAMPVWKQSVGRRLDALVTRTVPGVHKAVKWNSPFYGIKGQGWFLNFHCFRSTSRSPSSAARRSVLFRRANPSTRKCATSTSTRVISSTRRS
jgi:hypothetical protein